MTHTLVRQRRRALLALPVLLAACASTPAPDAMTVLRQADRAMGGNQLKTLHFSGGGTGTTFGQAWQPGMAWPGLNYSTLSRQVDYETAALREDFARSRSEPTGGGATPLMGQGEARVTAFVRGTVAWNGSGAAATAAPVAVDTRIHDLWTTPHGAVKAAMRNQPRAATRSEGGTSFTTVSFTEPGRFEATVWIDAAGLVTRIDSRLPHPVMGDTAVTTTYSGWRDVGGGVKFPQRMQQSQGGHPTFDIGIKDVKPNAPVEASVPDSVRSFAERVTADPVAAGVWFLAGGSHNSVAIEMKDHIVVVETPLYDGRAAAVLARANALVPGKTVRTVVNSHHHFDHAGGLRAAAASGAQLVTSERARPWFEKTFANANRISPDLLAASGRSVRITGVSGKHVISDGSRVIEVHELQGSVHAQGFLMVWLPAERLLIEADAYTPGAPGSPRPPAPNANHVNLVQNIERLGLKVDRILPLHSRVVPMSELLAAIGRL
jgi:glyoxylase-like metal-dependent hydrolase (beta-lactamase superfamily II)